MKTIKQNYFMRTSKLHKQANKIMSNKQASYASKASYNVFYLFLGLYPFLILFQHQIHVAVALWQRCQC